MGFDNDVAIQPIPFLRFCSVLSASSSRRHKARVICQTAAFPEDLKLPPLLLHIPLPSKHQ
jgi:hypothetical protein